MPSDTFWMVPWSSVTTLNLESHIYTWSYLFCKLGVENFDERKDIDNQQVQDGIDHACKQHV